MQQFLRPFRLGGHAPGEVQPSRQTQEQSCIPIDQSHFSAPSASCGLAAQSRRSGQSESDVQLVAGQNLSKFAQLVFLLVFRGVCWRMTSLLSYCFMNLCIMRDCIERVLRESPVSCQVSLHFPNHAMWQNISKTDKPSLWYFSNQVRQASQKQDARQAQNIYRPHGGRLAVLSRAAI